NWVKELNSLTPRRPFIVCGTKLDVREEYNANTNANTDLAKPDVTFISDIEADQLCRYLVGEIAMQCSALKNKNIDEVFYKGVELAIQWQDALDGVNEQGLDAKGDGCTLQ